MAKISNTPEYNPRDEITLGVVAPGHTVLLKSPEGNIYPYIICKIGNTQLVPHPSHKASVLLCNITTGRVVLKRASLKVVVVSHNAWLSEYNGEFKHVER